MTTISLCMTVSNGENNTRRCLESMRGLADEIINVDAGSTERMKSGISDASCDWILLLDADEEVEIRNPEGLRQYLSDTGYDLIPVRMTYFFGAKPADENAAYFSVSLRLIRNKGVVLVTDNFQEGIETNDKRIGGAVEIQSFIRIHNYDYMDDAAEGKAERSLPMLLSKRHDQPGDPWAAFLLASGYYRLGKLDEAFREVNTAIALFLGKKLKPPSLAYKLKYDLLVSSGHYDLAYSGIEKAIALYPDYVDLHFYKGILQYKREEYDKAKDTFLNCLILGEANMNYFILSGSGSFRAMHYLGLCHESQGKAEQAAAAFRQAKELRRKK